MGTYITCFIINMILGFLLVPKKHNCSANLYNRRVKIYLIFTTIQLGLLAGGRASSVGYDTWAYEIIFSNTPDKWVNMFSNTQYVEIGFSILCTIIKMFGGTFQTLLIISSFFIVGSCCVYIYRHSENVVLSIFTIVSFPFYYSTFDIMRFFIATSFILLGYKYIVERNFKKFLIYVFVGSLFHVSAVLFIPIYFVNKIKYTMGTFIIAILATVFAFMYVNEIALVFGRLIGKESYLSSGWIGQYGGGIKTAIMYIGILFIALVLFGHLKKKENEDYNAVNYILLLAIFSIIFIRARIMTRFIMISIPFLAISMPRLLNSQNTKNQMDRKICYFSYIVIGLVYHGFMLYTNWQNVVPYVPFWT